MNLSDDNQRWRLVRAMESSYRRLEPFRRLTAGLVEEYAGSGYGDAGTKVKRDIIVNLMNQAVDAYTMSLAANRPRVLVTTKQARLAWFAKHFQTALNNLIEEIELEHCLRQMVLNAFFCLGIVKVHMADSVPVLMEEGIWMDPGRPFASCVALDNWVHDMSATRWDQVRFAGDFYRLPFEDLKENPNIFDRKVVNQLSPSSKYGLTGDGEERLETISKGDDTDEDEVEPMIDLADVWIPREQKIFTFAMDCPGRFTAGKPPVAVMDWDGDETGPYEALSFNDVPENIMPTSPASHLSTLARIVNSIFRKGRRQANRQKDVHLYTPAGTETAKQIQRSSDGDWVKAVDTKDVNTLKMGGVDPGNHAFMLGVIEMFDRMAGNLSAMMGLGPQAKTLGQEQLIYGAVSKKEAQMQYRTIDTTVRVIRKLGRLLWDDQVKVIPGQIPVEGAPDYVVDSDWTPEERDGDFPDYQIGIDLYSMSYQSPAQRVQAINQLLTTVYLPAAPLLAQQGGMINFQKLAEIHADLLNLPRLKEVIQFGAPEMDLDEMSGPGQTTRTYERRNIPTGGTEKGRQHVEQQAWLSRAEPQTSAA